MKKNPQVQIVSSFFGTGKAEADTLGQLNKWLIVCAAAVLSHYLQKKVPILFISPE